MQGVAALGTAAFIPQGLSAQHVASTDSTLLPGRRELLIRGVTVLTMDPAVPDLAAGDVHVREGAIVAVAPMIEAPAAQVMDGGGMICIPGFVDTHFHLWNALFRLFVRADIPALAYFPVTARLGPLMEPEDSYRSLRLGAAEALAAGVTTVHNWSHNTRSPEHAGRRIVGHARHGHPRTFRLWHPCRHGRRRPDGLRRLGTSQEGLDTRQGQSAYAGHLLA
jgi:hypothetical protein